MDINCYNVQRMPETVSVSPDGTTISKLIVHPIQKGTHITLFGLGPNIEKDSICVISQTGTIATHYTVSGLVRGRVEVSEHQNYDDYRIQVIIRPRDKSKDILLPGVDSIDLMLTYITRSAFWIPHYTLDICSSGDAALTLQAELRPCSKVWEDATITVANYSASLKHMEVTANNRVGRAGLVPDQKPSCFAQHTWLLYRASLSRHTLENVQMRNVLVPTESGSEARPPRLKARRDVGSGSLPRGDMRILRQGNLIKSVQIPTWNPGEVLNFDLGEVTPAPALVGLRNTRFSNPCRISNILNPVSDESFLSHLQGNARYADAKATQMVAEQATGPKSPISVQGGATNPNSPRMEDFERGESSNLRPFQEATSTSLDSLHSMGSRHQEWSRGGQSIPGESVLPQHISREAATAAKTLVGLRQNPQPHRVSKGKGRSQTSLKKIDSSQSRPSQLSAKPQTVPVGIRISKYWRDSVAYEWATSRRQWEKLDTGKLELIEVFIEGGQEPIHLSSWSGHEWRGRLCNGSCLTMTDDEVTRLVEKGGFGYGVLH